MQPIDTEARNPLELEVAPPAVAELAELPETPAPVSASFEWPSPDHVALFRSGASRVTELRGYIAAGRAFGVEVHELSENGRALLVDAVLDGAAVFVDSGAFPAFRRGVRMTEADFDDVLGRYEALVDRLDATTGALAGAARGFHFVVPDVIGDQAETLRLQRHFGPRLRALAARGATLLVPLQGGALSLAACHAVAAELLGTDRFVAAVPGNEAAIPFAEVLAFVAEASPYAVHLLGVGVSVDLEALRAKIHAAAAPRLVIVTADANRLRAIVGKNRPFTRAVEAETTRRLAAAGQTRTPELLRALRPRVRAHVLARLEAYAPSSSSRPRHSTLREAA